MLTSKQLSKWFDEFAPIFEGDIIKVPTKAQYVGPDTWGLCWATEIHVKDTLSVSEARATLLHEMVHLWQAQHDYDMDHGDSFEQWREPCRSRTGLEL